MQDTNGKRKNEKEEENGEGTGRGCGLLTAGLDDVETRTLNTCDICSADYELVVNTAMPLVSRAGTCLLYTSPSPRD